MAIYQVEKECLVYFIHITDVAEYHQINTFGAEHYETSLNLNMRFNTNRAKRKRKWNVIETP